MSLQNSPCSVNPSSPVDHVPQGPATAASSCCWCICITYTSLQQVVKYKDWLVWLFGLLSRSSVCFKSEYRWSTTSRSVDCKISDCVPTVVLCASINLSFAFSRPLVLARFTHRGLSVLVSKWLICKGCSSTLSFITVCVQHSSADTCSPGWSVLVSSPKGLLKGIYNHCTQS